MVTPREPFYIFSTRDIFKLIKSIFYSNVTKEMKTSDALVRLWYHEVMRIFGDRMSAEEKVKLNGIVLDAMREHFNFELEGAFIFYINID